MRNGYSGFGVVLNTNLIPEEDRSALVELDGVLVMDPEDQMLRLCPVMVAMDKRGSRWKYDIVEFVSSESDLTAASMIRESVAKRIVFIGSPGPETIKALRWLETGGRYGHIIPLPDPGVSFRVVWKGTGGHTFSRSPAWQNEPLGRVGDLEISSPEPMGEE